MYEKQNLPEFKDMTDEITTSEGQLMIKTALQGRDWGDGFAIFLIMCHSPIVEF